ncbi:UNVERIFIED_CONTAM: hypothetical protein HHA_259080 [Hammondia hammondi]|eukprot:XP_008883100.1 hypothetical protein HHA_259080 [Hammondia hammondi]
MEGNKGKVPTEEGSAPGSSSSASESESSRFCRFTPEEAKELIHRLFSPKSFAGSQSSSRERGKTKSGSATENPDSLAALPGAFLSSQPATQTAVSKFSRAASSPSSSPPSSDPAGVSASSASSPPSPSALSFRTRSESPRTRRSSSAANACMRELAEARVEAEPPGRRAKKADRVFRSGESTPKRPSPFASTLASRRKRRRALELRCTNTSSGDAGLQDGKTVLSCGDRDRRDAERGRTPVARLDPGAQTPEARSVTPRQDNEEREKEEAREDDMEEDLAGEDSRREHEVGTRNEEEEMQDDGQEGDQLEEEEDREKDLEILFVIVAYRDRRSQLLQWIPSMSTYLRSVMTSVRRPDYQPRCVIVIAEQADSHPFNKGALFNAAVAWILDNASRLPFSVSRPSFSPSSSSAFAFSSARASSPSAALCERREKNARGPGSRKHFPRESEQMARRHASQREKEKCEGRNEAADSRLPGEALAEEEHEPGSDPPRKSRQTSQKSRREADPDKEERGEQSGTGETLTVSAAAFKSAKQFFLCFHDVDIVPRGRYDDFLYRDNRPCAYFHSPPPKCVRQLYGHRWCLGGVVVLRCTDFLRAQAWSVRYPGWGFEDDDFLARCLYAGLWIDQSSTPGVRPPRLPARHPRVSREKALHFDSGDAEGGEEQTQKEMNESEPARECYEAACKAKGDGRREGSARRKCEKEMHLRDSDTRSPSADIGKGWKRRRTCEVWSGCFSERLSTWSAFRELDRESKKQVDETQNAKARHPLARANRQFFFHAWRLLEETGTEADKLKDAESRTETTRGRGRALEADQSAEQEGNREKTDAETRNATSPGAGGEGQWRDESERGDEVQVEDGLHAVWRAWREKKSISITSQPEMSEEILEAVEAVTATSASGRRSTEEVPLEEFSSMHRREESKEEAEEEREHEEPANDHSDGRKTTQIGPEKETRRRSGDWHLLGNEEDCINLLWVRVKLNDVFKNPFAACVSPS